MKQLSNLLIILSLYLSANTKAQNQATLQGKVTEAKTGDDAINAYVKLIKGGVAKTTVATDFEGNYTTNIDPGTYDVEVSYVGMATSLIKGVVLNGGRITRLDVKLNTNDDVLDPLIIKIYCPPIIRQDEMTSGAIYTAEQIRNSPVRFIYW